jgi:hypothetical protein
MKIELFEDWTIDYRLKQFRRCKDGWENGGKIDFIDFDSDLGQAIFEKKILVRELNDLQTDVENKVISLDDFIADQKQVVKELVKVNDLIFALEKEQTNE